MILRPASAILIMLLAAPAVLLAASARAEDTIVDVPPCNVFCSVWRNVSGTVPTSVVAPADSTAPSPSEPLPNAVDGAEKPRPGSLVQRRGVIMSESSAERAAAKRQRAKLDRELVANPALAIYTHSSDVKR